MSKVTIYHNPRCSKSRQTLALLEEKGFEPEIVLYLENPPAQSELADIINKLGFKAADLLRKGEAAYKELDLANPSLTDEDIIKAMTEQPILIERPIVVCADRARIGRPPESVLEMLAS